MTARRRGVATRRGNLHPSRGHRAVTEFAVPDYRGVTVHDALLVYDAYPDVTVGGSVAAVTSGDPVADACPPLRRLVQP